METIEKLTLKYCKDVMKKHDGHLDLMWLNTPFTLPNNLRVKDSLILTHSGITELPKKVYVKHNIFLSKTKIDSLPKNLKKVHGSLEISDTKITKIPKLKIEGHFCAENIGISELPEGILIGKSVFLSNTKITKIPKSLQYINGYLELQGSMIKELPQNLRVAGDLNLSNTPITELPEGLYVEGNLNLTNSKIEKLPEGLYVGSNLLLQNTPIKELPEGMNIENNLKISGTHITKLPQSLRVGGSIDISSRGVVEIPKGVKNAASEFFEKTHQFIAGQKRYIYDISELEYNDFKKIAKEQNWDYCVLEEYNSEEIKKYRVCSTEDYYVFLYFKNLVKDK